MVKITGGETLKCTPKLKQDVRNLLCDKDKKELTYSDIKKGLVKFHPDKNLGANKDAAVENYKIVNNAKDECFENKNATNYTIKCTGVAGPSRPVPPPPPTPQAAPRPGPAPKAPPKPKKPKAAPTINKDAECIRKVGTFTHIKPEFKMDKRTFKPETLKDELPVVSPKLVALIEKIEELDREDMAKDKLNYKHCIYIDFKGTYAKVVAAAMIAHGFNMIFDRDMTIDEKDILKTKGKNFAFLSSSTIYDKTMKVPFRKEMVDLFNRRPENIHGDYIKYIILDSGFREGLDLYDTKYCHIIQDLPSAADERQAVGRNTRLCGQAGLKFHPTKGWPLQVYKYDIELTENLQDKFDANRMFDLFLRYNNVDIREIRFAVDLDKIITEIAVDSYLTKNIHEFTIKKEKDEQKLLTHDAYSAPESSLGIARIFDLEGGAKKKKTLHPKPPLIKKDFPSMYEYVKDRFSAYKWPLAKLENQCKLKGGKPQIVKLNETQNFLRLYFQPPSAYKGVLLSHGTGTGKTCCAIAIASTSWETAGYTILYVTRHTLKSDVYKNMFRQVCSQTIKRAVQKEEIDIPDGKIKSPSRFLPDAWMQPISFKQFSNACLKKNDVYRELKKKNGEADPFKKTLIIIDEAHKMYSTDVIGSERPDVDAITTAIQNSYKVSGKNSARLLLMTATPYTTNPMDLVKLVNLMKEENNQMPVKFTDFYEEYLDDDGSFSTAGKKFFANDLSGYVSYLNRSNDARQFAYPIFHQEMVPMSRSETEEKKRELYRIFRRINQLKMEIDNSVIAVKETKRRFKEQINEATEECKELPKPERKDCLLENVEPLKEASEATVNQIKRDALTKKAEIQRIKNESKRLAYEVKNASKVDFSQEFALTDKCNVGPPPAPPAPPPPPPPPKKSKSTSSETVGSTLSSNKE
jgi:hypothetical protein